MRQEIKLTAGLGWDTPGPVPALRLSMGFVPQHGALRPVQPPQWASPSLEVVNMPEQPPFPVLEFALRRDSYLSISDTFDVPAAMAPLSSAGGSGAGASSIHAATQSEQAGRSAAAKAVAQAYQRAVSEQAESYGLFHQPFMVRYALRMANGVHILPSSPALMLCATLPPCLYAANIQASDEDGLNTLTISGDKYPLLRLRCRLLQPIPDGWEGKIAGIDIYASAPILTYDDSAASQRGLQAYGDICSGANMGSHRGRSQELPADEILAGVWSEGDGPVQQRTLASIGAANVRAWHFAPNPALSQQIAAADTFYHICHLPLSQLQQAGGFIDVPVSSTSPKALKGCPVLEDCESSWLCISPSISLQHHDRTLYAAGSCSPSLPLPVRSMGAFVGDASAAAIATASLSAVSLCHGQKTKSHLVCTGYAVPVSQALPRYIYHPDPDCSLLAVSQGYEHYLLPMSPHPTLPGSYWMGSLLCLDHSSAVRVDNAPQLDYPEHIGTPNLLVQTCTGNPYCYDLLAEIGNGAIIALTPANRAMSSGQFGQHPIYAFCTDGVWALRMCDNGYQAAHCVNSDACLGLHAIATVRAKDGEGIAYLCSEGLRLLTGSKSECLSGDIFGLNEAGAGMSLPFWDELAQELPIAAFDDVMANGQLHWDGYRGLLFVVAEGQSLAYCYSMESQKWGMVPMQAGSPGLIVTQPWSIGCKQIVSVEAVGRYASGEVQLALYGSCDLRHWTLCGSSVTGRVHTLSGTPYPYYVAALRIVSPATDLALWSIAAETAD